MNNPAVWSEHETNLLLTLRPYLTTDELFSVFSALKLPRTTDAITGKANRAGVAFLGCGMPDLEDFDQQTREIINNILEHRKENLQELREQAERDVQEARLWIPALKPPPLVVRATIEDLKGKLEQIYSNSLQKVKLEKSAKKLSQQGEGTPSCVLLLSDTHFGCKTDKFNIEVARERIASIPKMLASGLRGSREVVLCLMGDIVDGEEIYATQASNLDDTLLGQIEAAVAAIWNLILEFERTNHTITIHTVPGNHGRMSKTASETTNWDNIVYMMLGILCNMHNSQSISINLNYEEFLHFQVKDKKILMNHYGTKHLGTPAMKVKMAGWDQTRPYDLFMHGHYHQWRVDTIFGKPVVSNGSLVGPDSLAQRMGESDPARQGYFFVKEEQPFYGFSFLEWE